MLNERADVGRNPVRPSADDDDGAVKADEEHVAGQEKNHIMWKSRVPCTRWAVRMKLAIDTVLHHHHQQLKSWW